MLLRMLDISYDFATLNWALHRQRCAKFEEKSSTLMHRELQSFLFLFFLILLFLFIYFIYIFIIGVECIFECFNFSFYQVCLL